MGWNVGIRVGEPDGKNVGLKVGSTVGSTVGKPVEGLNVGTPGIKVYAKVGILDGLFTGEIVGV